MNIGSGGAVPDVVAILQDLQPQTCSMLLEVERLIKPCLDLAAQHHDAGKAHPLASKGDSL